MTSAPSFNDLSQDKQSCQGLRRVMPFDYNSGKISWIFYEKIINKAIICALTATIKDTNCCCLFPVN